MTLEVIDSVFSVCKLNSMPETHDLGPLFFLSKTDREISLVCPSDKAPSKYISRDEGWRAFRVSGSLDFSLIGILSRLSTILAEASIGIFAVSTFDTDYILTKEENFSRALKVLEEHSYIIEYLKDF